VPEHQAAVDTSFERALDALRNATSIVVLTGAGISTDSGIPDFRGQNGVWTKNPDAEKRSALSHYVADPAIRRAAWEDRLTSPVWDARPNAGHVALAELARRAPLDLLVTQNIDGLHQLAGSSPDLVLEIHGTAREFKCLDCGARGPMEEALARVRAGDDDPHCVECGGILKSATISFGEALVPTDLARAHAAAGRADVFVAVGTSLAVYPAAGLPELALRRGARLVIVNGAPTPFDAMADAVVRAPIGTALPHLVDRLTMGNNRPQE
jgi:NAD-dependent deacetylase